MVGEAPGEREDADRLPFRPHAPAGSVLDRTIRRASLDRSQFAIWNQIACRPPKNFLEHAPYEFDAINHCRQHMDQIVQRFKPKVMLAFGNVPVRSLAGYSGPKQGISNVRGFYLDNLWYPGIPVIGSIHPSAIARDKPNLLGVMRMDVLRAVALARAGGKFSRPVKHYRKFPNISEAEEWEKWLRLHPELLIVRDIETSDSITGEDESALRVNSDGAIEFSPLKPEFADAPEEEKEKEEAIASEYKYTNTDIHITQVQFSVLGEMDAIVLPWDNGPFSALALRVMALPNMKAGWHNWGFDDPVAAMMGERINGVNHDAMWMFHHLQPDLPRGLQYGMSFYFPEAEPWKHRAQDDLGEYGGDDVSYLRIAVPKLIEALKTRGIWAGYERHVLGLHSILVGATRRGIPVDNGRRVELGEKVDRLKGGVDVELQGMFPDHLRGCEPKQGYVNPKIAEKRKGGPNGGLEEGERWGERWFHTKSVAGRGEDLREVDESAPGIVSKDMGVGEIGTGTGNYDGEVYGESQFQTLPGGPESTPNDDRTTETIHASSELPGQVLRWCRIQPFLPNSSQQILKYIRWRREEEVQAKIATYRGSSRWASWPERALREMAERNALYKVPTKFKEGTETTEKKELERLGARTGDRFFSLVVEHREYGKVKSTYVDGWSPAEDGRSHPVFGFAPATGQLSSVRPASMTMPKPGGDATLAEARKTQLAHWCRGMVVAPPGHKLVFVDKKSYHAKMLGREARDLLYLRITQQDIHSFITANFMWSNERSAFLNAGLPPNPESWIQRSDQELGELLGIVKKNWRAIRDKKAKPCIAEGELVLTDKGLVPIQNITLDHRLWDGVEWITHSGVVCRGVKDVMHYDGLTATPNHQVFCSDGQERSLEEAQSIAARLMYTGDGRTPLWPRDRARLEDSARRRWAEATNSTLLPMSRLWGQEMDQSRLPLGRDYDRVSIVCSTEISASDCAWQAIRRHSQSVLQSQEREIQRLWWAWNFVHFRLPERVCAVDSEEFAPSGLQGDRDRPREQQWPLHSGESTSCIAERTDVKQARQSMVDFQGTTDSIASIRESLRTELDRPESSGRLDWGTDYRTCNSDGPKGKSKDMAISEVLVTRARVYDIVNAGPRFCYTVSGKLVFNCILGIGLGLGDAKCFELNKRDEVNPKGFDSKAEVTKFKNVLKGLFPSIFRFHENTKQLAHRQGYLTTLYGYMRWFFDVYYNSYKGGQWIQEAGKDAEAAIALPVQNHSHGMLKDEVLILDGMGALERFGFMNIVHDELQFCCPDPFVEECLHVVPEVMNRPAIILADSVVAPNGLVCETEVSVGRTWDSMEGWNGR